MRRPPRHFSPAALPEALKTRARELRSRITDAEKRLWCLLHGNRRA